MRNLTINETSQISGGSGNIFLGIDNKGVITFILRTAADSVNFNGCFFNWLGWGEGSYAGVNSLNANPVCNGYNVTYKIDVTPNVIYTLTPSTK